MASPTFQIVHVPRVAAQLKELIEKAARTNQREIVADALATIVAGLQNDPANFGDPAYSTQRPGGVVCNRIVQPLHVRFAVFEKDRVVFLSHIAEMSGSGLE
jgi:hypothetical protein